MLVGVCAMSNYPNKPNIPPIKGERTYALPIPKKEPVEDELETLKREIAQLKDVVRQLADIINVWIQIEHPDFGERVFIPF